MSSEKPSDDLVRRVETLNAAGSLPPVDDWHPPLNGDIDIVIRSDGTWLHEGSPIERQSLVRLFSTILRREEDGCHYLVTPVEKWRLRVEDAPFLAVSMGVNGKAREQIITFETNVGDKVVAGAEHPIRFAGASGADSSDPGGSNAGGPRPYVLVRGGLEALIARAVYYDLVELAVEDETGGETRFGVWSNGAFMPFAPAEALRV